MVNDKITVKTVIGANYGDEGKGQMADYFCHLAKTQNKKCLNVCTNGGAQRGHTVQLPDGRKHIFSHFGSGTFCEAGTYLPSGYILNPILFRAEYEQLKAMNVSPETFVHPLCRWSTPYDMILNQIKEEYRGKNRHGSCGVGIWETVKRFRNGDYVTIADFHKMDIEEKKAYLGKIKKYMYDNLASEGFDTLSEHWKKIVESDALVENYIQDFEYMYKNITQRDESILNEYNYIVFENGQGLLLDQNRVPVEHTTPSNTGHKDIKKMLESIKKDYSLECCYITRTYLTRHGAGPFSGECDKKEINPLCQDTTNVENVHQGRLRYGLISVDEMKKRIFEDFEMIENSEVSLLVTHINETDGYFADEKKSKPDILCGEFDRIYVSSGKTRESIKYTTDRRGAENDQNK